jgi:hypothetical protein
MGEKISPFSRLALSYDMVFLALVRTALTKEKIENAHFRCKLKPTKKRNYIKTNNALIYSSCAAAILSYYKFMDDMNDAKKIKRFFLRLLFPVRLFLSRMRKNARRYYPGLEEKLTPSLSKLSELEKNNCASIDQAASCFAELMKNAASFGLETPAQIKAAEAIGSHLGRWLYIIDALDDFDRDIKKREYNPFVEYYGNKSGMAKDIDIIRASLASSLDEASAAFCGLIGEEGLGTCVNPIVLNIINLGLCDRQEKIFGKLGGNINYLGYIDIYERKR